MATDTIVGDVVSCDRSRPTFIVEATRGSSEHLVGRQVRCVLSPTLLETQPRPMTNEYVRAVGQLPSGQEPVFVIEQVVIEVSSNPKIVSKLISALAASKKWPSGVARAVIERIEQTGDAKDLITWFNEKAESWLKGQNREEICEYFDGVLTIDQVSKLLSWWKFCYLDRQLLLLGLNRWQIKAVTKYRTHDDVINLIKTNPYALLELELDTCDAIVKTHPWYYTTQPSRSAGVIGRHVAEQLKDQHNMYSAVDFLRRTFPTLDADMPMLTSPDYAFTVTGDRMYTPHAFAAETEIANSVATLMTKPKSNAPLKQIGGDKLCDEQWTAVTTALTHPISIITGGAGTGKTTIIGEIARQLEAAGNLYAVVSFTGRAVLVIRKKTGLSNTVSTIHSMLYNADLCKRMHTLVIDEVSMCPTSLFLRVVRQCRVLTRLVLVGDPHQLPPISWSCLIWPLLEVPGLPRSHLTENHRTAPDGGGVNTIVTESNRLVADTTGRFVLHPGGNLIWYDGGVAEITALVTQLQERGYTGWNITIVVPYKELAQELNLVCQALFNGANTREMTYSKTLWRLGDRVMVTQNMRDYDLYNGDEGEIIDLTEAGITVKIRDVEQLFTWEASEAAADVDSNDPELSATPVSKILTHSWVLTTHKAQGSEWPVVIAYVPRASSFITRNLVYVMLTRAQQYLFLFGSQWAVTSACNNPARYGRNVLANRVAKTLQCYSVAEARGEEAVEGSD